MRKMPPLMASIASFSTPAWRSLRRAYTARDLIVCIEQGQQRLASDLSKPV